MSNGIKDEVVLSSPVSPTDWVWRNDQKKFHGPESVRYVLDRCKEAGFQKLYWRCLDGGRSNYTSDLMDYVGTGVDPDNYHAWFYEPGIVENMDNMYSRMAGYDNLQVAVEYGHKIGLEIHAWVTLNEDDHAWGLTSRFSREHPQFRWVKQSGLPYNSQLSFAFEEVREYKLELLKEILQYDIDGIFFDWIRTGDVRNDPQVTPCGTADFGYEKPLVEAFTKEFGDNPMKIPNNDERWVRFRAQPQTLFMREAHKLIKAKDKSLPIAIMGHHDMGYRGVSRVDGNLNGLLLDVGVWAEDKLIDSTMAAGYFYQSDGEDYGYKSAQDPVGDAYNYAKNEVNGNCDVWLFWWVPSTIENYNLSVETARKLGAKQILYWESDYIDNPENKAFSDGMKKRIKASGKA